MEGTKPIVSVIIPCYNNEEIIHRPLCSLLKSTFTSFEVVVVDAGRDNTFKVAESMREIFRSKQITLKVFKIEDRGVSYSRNYGFKKASGDFLFFLDSDGEVESTTIEKALATYFRLSSNYGPAIGAIQCIIEVMRTGDTIYGSIVDKLGFGWGNVKPPLERKYEIYNLDGNGIMMPRKVFKEICGFDEYFFFYFEPTDLAFRLLSKGYLIWVNKDVKIREIKGGTRFKHPFPSRMKKFIRYHLALLIIYYPLRYLFFVFPIAFLIDAFIASWCLAHFRSMEGYRAFKLLLRDLSILIRKRRLQQNNKWDIVFKKIWERMPSLIETFGMLRNQLIGF
ncbi:MAG: glycosyltransferase [Nitrososphaerota archaeon]|nr:glycosyltransferase [Nitrososphaerota archaeon]